MQYIKSSSIYNKDYYYYNDDNNNKRKGEALERVGRVARESAVVVFSVSGCCMCHAVKRLFSGMGVSPTVYELDLHPSGPDLHTALQALLACGPHNNLPLPVVFVGGKLLGAIDHVMASHINGSLVPLLKDAGALWL